MANGDIEATSTATSSTAVKAASATTSTAGAVGAAGSLLDLTGTSISGATFPLVNVLHKYASMTHIFTLAALSPQDLADPEKTYMAGSKVPIILKTAGGSPTNRVKTKYGQFDFYLDDLQISTVYGLNDQAGNTSVQSLKFTITEPYSMGMLTVALNQAALQAGYPAGFRECPFLLKIEFKGADQNGNMVNIPKTTKFLPIVFENIDMEVTEGGSTYNCQMRSVSAGVFRGSNVTITSDLTITGSTVVEILQTGPRSLQAELNKRLQSMALANKIPVPDEVVILFPPGMNSTAVQKGEDEKATNKPATAPVVAPGTNSRVFGTLGVSRSKVNNSLSQTQINEIGAQDLGYSELRKPKNPAINTSDLYDDAGFLQPSAVTINPKISDYVFKKASSIQNAINQVILTSDYAKNALKKDPDELGFRKWWRIETEMYHIEDDATLTATGRFPQIMVYKVIPYKVHATNAPVPGGKSSKFSALLNECVKIYNYIYTGKNSDILGFKLKFDSSFYSAMDPAAYAGREPDSDPTSKQRYYSVDRPTGEPRNQTEGQNNVAAYKIQAKTEGKGGGGEELPEHAAARTFYDAIQHGKDLENIKLDIVGDPYWLTSNGWGNYNARPTTFLNILSDGSVDWQNSEVDMAINFSTPIDINPVTGMYTMAGKRSAQFSGLFRVQEIEHVFREGSFTQTLTAVRRPINKSDTPEDIVFSTKKTTDVPPDQGKQ